MPVLATKQTCTGCSSCSNICPHNAISIYPDEQGFLIPRIDTDKCVECKLCEKVCPIINGKNLRHSNVNCAYAFWDNKTRTESSSGGAFSAIARWVLDKNGIIFGAAWQDGFNCIHIGCNTEDEVSRLRGSKYLQSDIRSTYVEAREALKNGSRQPAHTPYAKIPC